MRSHLLAESSDKGLCGFATAHDMKNMKISTLLAAAFALVGFCNTASAVTYPLPTDGSRLIGQNQVITVPDNNKQPLEYFAAKYQMGRGYLSAEERHRAEYPAAADSAGHRA